MERYALARRLQVAVAARLAAPPGSVSFSEIGSFSEGEAEVIFSVLDPNGREQETSVAVCEREDVYEIGLGQQQFTLSGNCTDEELRPVVAALADCIRRDR
jgi:hypothetical protein